MSTTGSAPAKRPPRAEVRERLIEAASRLFARHGVHTTTLDDVAKAAGFSKGAVYSNFDSKADLVVTLLRRETDGALRALHEMRVPGTDLPDLPAAIRAAFAPYGAGTADDFSLMSELRSQALAEPRVMEVFVEQRRAVLDTLRGLVDQVFQGRTPDATGLSSDQLARLLITISVGSAFDAPATGDVAPGDLMGDVVAALLRPVTGGSPAA
jgi:AcrR family transcriptional regulator